MYAASHPARPCASVLMADWHLPEPLHRAVLYQVGFVEAARVPRVRDTEIASASHTVFVISVAICIKDTVCTNVRLRYDGWGGVDSSGPGGHVHTVLSVTGSATGGGHLGVSLTVVVHVRRMRVHQRHQGRPPDVDCPHFLLCKCRPERDVTLGVRSLP